MPCWGKRFRHGRQRQQGAARDVRSVGKGGAGHGRIGRYRRSHRRGPSPPGGGSGALRPARGCVGGAGCAVGRGRPCGALRSRRSRRPRGPARAGGGGGGCARHPRPLRRNHPRRSRAPHEGRGLAGGPGRQSQRRLRARPRLPARHAPPALGAAHLHHLGGGHDRQCRAGQLCRLQGLASRGW